MKVKFPALKTVPIKEGVGILCGIFGYLSLRVTEAPVVVSGYVVNTPLLGILLLSVAAFTLYPYLWLVLMGAGGIVTLGVVFTGAPYGNLVVAGGLFYFGYRLHKS